jgi:hypothetical protein
VASWAHDHAAALRQLAGAITALPDLPAAAADALGDLHTALGGSDPAQLLGPLTAAGPHLGTAHADLADRVSEVGRHTREMRENERRQRSAGSP